MDDKENADFTIDSKFQNENFIFKTGFNDLDELVGGIKSGDLIVVGGRPAMGKSSLALNIITNISAKSDKACLFFSGYMTAKNITKRLLIQKSNIGFKKFEQKDLNDDDLRKISKSVCELSSSKIFIDDSNWLLIENIINESREKKLDDNLSLVVIDCLQLIKMEEDYCVSSNIAEIMTKLKLLAIELNCPVIILSEVKRSIEKSKIKRPKITSLPDSDLIQSAANIILLVYRDEVYHPNTLEPGIAEIIVSKNDNGRTGTVKIKWEGACGSFENL
jgi:replicative DNA helicase